LLLDRVTIALPEDTAQIYHRYFSTLSTREFKKLIMNNEFCFFQDDMIINAGESANRLYIVLRGTVNIVKDGATLATLDPGDFIGEMGFLTKDEASASAYAENLVQCAFWTHADLEKMKLKNNGVYDKFIAIIGCDLVRKLKHRNDQHVDLITKLDFVI
jgi:CRP-like cAMP-binding protein